MKITLRKIADMTGYSITTVSRALAGYNDVNEDTRRRIVMVADELGYVPDQTARRLQSQRSQTIGLVLPLTDTFSDPFFIELLVGIGHQASKQGYDLLISAQIPGDDELNAYHRMVSGSRVDGTIIARTRLDDPRITYLQQKPQPFVAYGHTEAATYPYVDVDGYQSLYCLTEHFVKYGHRHIAIILSPVELAFTRSRLAGYRAALEAYGLVVNDKYIEEGDLTQRSGLECATTLLALADPPTAIIGCNDLMALGAMTAIRRQGLQPGMDVAVAGYDDIPASSEADPPLTTVHQPIREIGRKLTDMLISLIHGEPLEQTQVLMEPKLIIRASSGQPLI